MHFLLLLPHLKKSLIDLAHPHERLPIPAIANFFDNLLSLTLKHKNEKGHNTWKKKNPMMGVKS